MSWLERIRKKSHDEKVKLIWIICGWTAAVLVIVWIVSAHYAKRLPTDPSLFTTLGQSFHDLKQNFNNNH